MNEQVHLKRKSKTKIANIYDVTWLRYILFYNDDLVSDSFKLKSKILFTSAEDHFFDMRMLTDKLFQRKLLNDGRYFAVDISPTKIKTGPLGSGGFTDLAISV